MAGYLYHTIKIHCSKGTMDNYLNVVTDHGVIWEALDDKGNKIELPLCNANDHVKDDNIVHFGRCTSESNKVIGGDRHFHLGSISDWVGMTIGACDGYKCTPYCSRAWVTDDAQVWLDGAPVIHGKSHLTCYYGGTISYEIIEEDDNKKTDKYKEDERVKDA